MVIHLGLKCVRRARADDVQAMVSIAGQRRLKLDHAMGTVGRRYLRQARSAGGGGHSAADGYFRPRAGVLVFVPHRCALTHLAGGGMRRPEICQRPVLERAGWWPWRPVASGPARASNVMVQSAEHGAAAWYPQGCARPSDLISAWPMGKAPCGGVAEDPSDGRSGWPRHGGDSTGAAAGAGGLAGPQCDSGACRRAGAGRDLGSIHSPVAGVGMSLIDLERRPSCRLVCSSRSA